MDFGYGPRIAVDQSVLRRVGWTSDVAIDRIARLAVRRNQNKRMTGVTDRKCDENSSSVAVDEDGLCGELAVGDWLGVSIDEAVYPGADAGYDLVSKTGRTVDVKATKKVHGRLFFNDLRAFKAEIAVLVVIAGVDTCPHCHEAGCLAPDESAIPW
jgi:hypothetical protein